MRIYGPYKSGTSPRLFVIRIDEHGNRETTSYARHLMEEHLGRELDPDETVDHIDGDPMNDALDNLQLMSMGDNIRKSHPEQEVSTHICPWCGTTFDKAASRVRGNRKQGKAGPFCSKSCAGKWSVAAHN